MLNFNVGYAVGVHGLSCASVSSCCYISSLAFHPPPLGISLRRLRVLCVLLSSYLISDLQSSYEQYMHHNNIDIGIKLLMKCCRKICPLSNFELVFDWIRSLVIHLHPISSSKRDFLFLKRNICISFNQPWLCLLFLKSDPGGTGA